MTSKEELRAAAAAATFGEDEGWEVVTTPATMVVSARIPGEWAAEFAAEMERRGLANQNQLIKTLVREGLDRAKAQDGMPADTLTVLLGQAQQVVEQLRRAA
jgi:hypothetical protein